MSAAIGGRSAAAASMPRGVREAARRRPTTRLAIALRAAIATLIVFALWHLGQAAYIQAKAWLAQYLVRAAWERTLAHGQPAKPWSWADTWPVARITMPRLGIERFALAGDSGRTLAFGPGHRFGTPLPGADGNAVVSAHRDTHFGFLREVAIGDSFEVEDARGMRRGYRVIDARVAHKSELRLFGDDGTPALTLVTCWPFDATARGPLRYVVRAVAHETMPGAAR